MPSIKRMRRAHRRGAAPGSRVAAHAPKAGAGGNRAPGTLDFDAVYQAHAQTVARWAARLGGPGVDAEDITQGGGRAGGVVLVWDRRRRQFRGESHLATWLFSVTAKIVANDRRRRRLRRWWLRLT